MKEGVHKWKGKECKVLWAVNAFSMARIRSTMLHKICCKLRLDMSATERDQRWGKGRAESCEVSHSCWVGQCPPPPFPPMRTSKIWTNNGFCAKQNQWRYTASPIKIGLSCTSIHRMRTELGCHGWVATLRRIWMEGETCHSILLSILTAKRARRLLFELRFISLRHILEI